MPGRRVIGKKKGSSSELDIPEFLRWVVDYQNGYRSERSIIPLYDDIWRYLDNIERQKDYEDNTGRKMAYGSSGFTFGNASNLVNGITRTVRNATYSVGNLSKRF